jgi:hypothetical protein
MRISFFIAILMSVIIMAAAPGMSKTPVDDIYANGCGDDRGNDRCAADMQEKMRSSYGIKDTKSLMTAGTTLRRAMIVDGYGNDVVAISFFRAAGAAPALEVRVPCAGKKNCPNPLTVNITQQMWDQVVKKSENFDQKLAREIPLKRRGRVEPTNMCLHSWVVVVEAADAVRLEQYALPAGKTEGLMRSDTEDGCANGLAVPYAFYLAELARQSLPECSTLQHAWFRNDSELLAFCAQLKGDRHAAGEAYEIVLKLNGRGSDELKDMPNMFTFNEEELSEKFTKAINGGRLLLGVPEAADQDHATVAGMIAFANTKTDGGEVADVVLSLSRQSDDFVIAAFKLGERKPLPKE